VSPNVTAKIQFPEAAIIGLYGRVFSPDMTSVHSYWIQVCWIAYNLAKCFSARWLAVIQEAREQGDAIPDILGGNG
jgi:hypothetical protein